MCVCVLVCVYLCAHMSVSAYRCLSRSVYGRPRVCVSISQWDFCGHVCIHLSVHVCTQIYTDPLSSLGLLNTQLTPIITSHMYSVATQRRILLKKSVKHSPIQDRYCVFFIVSQVPAIPSPPPGPLTVPKWAYVSEAHGKQTSIRAGLCNFICLCVAIAMQKASTGLLLRPVSAAY